MLTLFTTPKPFRGHIGIIQRNALKSWTLLDPDVEIILFGDDDGAEQAAAELGIRHEPLVERDVTGNKRLDYLFQRAQEIASHDLLCYINCDILLTNDFSHSIKRMKSAYHETLMVGRRWDLDMTEPLSFDRPDWQIKLLTYARKTGVRRGPEWIDYFVFTRGLFGPDLPPFVVGRVFWDNWLLWKALHSKYPVIDASPSVIAVHQNHDYSYHPQGKQGVFDGEESGRNYRLAGGWNHLRTIADATYLLQIDQLRTNRMRSWSAIQRWIGQSRRALLYYFCKPAWFLLLGITRPLRNALGLRAGELRRLKGKA